ncbi:CIC11C00000000474 [Sungouiella intermedia]|uniref:Pyridoxal phosphate homeostasis protein n=1 Tax=Sungouiella intermedia TaxID=45354 RepID=A0A1L0BKZ9_9ASCO|nr:CIC11C00000000474 [[Candida] intermedia]
MSFPQATPERLSELIENYEQVLNQVKSHQKSAPVTLVAVSKLKPSSDIMALYNHGVRHFGENYVQELIGKAKELPQDIKWHFIGGLQTGKCKDLGKDIANLYAVETIDALKKCKKLDAARKAANLPVINVYLQVNTSGEEQKSGYRLNNLEEVYETVNYLTSSDCQHLELQGLMTIGSFAQSTLDGEVNEDFAKLVEMKEILDKKYSTDLKLSMGMSSDFTTAISQGSTSVRVGSSIFGARPPRNGH